MRATIPLAENHASGLQSHGYLCYYIVSFWAKRCPAALNANDARKTLKIEAFLASGSYGAAPR